jgi:DNA-binding transcriptional MerR regulator
MTKPLTIGEIAKATGVQARTIRYYEQVGVMSPPRRTPAGYRQYGERAVEELLFIRRGRALGLSLDDLRPLTASLNGGSRAGLRPRLLRLVREQLLAVRQRVCELELLRQQLQEVEQRIVAGPGSDGAGRCRCLGVASSEGR